MRHLPPILSEGTDILVPPLMYYGIPIPEDDTLVFAKKLAKELQLKGKLGRASIKMVYGLTVDQAPSGTILALEGNLEKLNNPQEFIDEVVNMLQLGTPKWYLSFDMPFYSIIC
ncbi:hypothetical protein BDZ94DRAFT_1265587 [Collybia nuda]|uniref:Uncharacterized protein n=1 Tax=Collybia nuda TaxID=64659 RepID=A0A9P5Y1L5_9AGAR|nr:hypothetical protein BDZ94DRAFT_1265587 [Collybia nuda]